MRYITLFLFALCTGCATIVTGTSTDVSLNSNPSEAQIQVDGRDFGETPKTVTLDSGRSHAIKISLDEYETETVQIQKTTSGWMVGNLLFGGLPGFIIDAASGGMYVLSPKQASVSMQQKTASAGQLHINVTMKPQTDGLRKIGQLDRVKK